MAMAVQKLYPGAQVTIGPAIERGFYYDFDMPEPITEKDLKAIKQEMQRIIKADLPFTREEVCCLHCTYALLLLAGAKASIERTAFA